MYVCMNRWIDGQIEGWMDEWTDKKRTDVIVSCLSLQVLATGLSAIYSSLPTSVELSDDEWHSPLSELEMSVPQLKKFMQALSFCNSVLQVIPSLHVQYINIHEVQRIKLRVIC